MKKKIILWLTSLVVLLPMMSGCAEKEYPPSDVVKTALASVRTSHKVYIEQTTTVLKPQDPLAVDIHIAYDNEYGYYYQGDEKSFSRLIHSTFVDLDKETGEWNETTIRTKIHPEERYFKDEDGTVYAETINIKNEIEKVTYAFFDNETGVYRPVIFDTQFKNPFDYITYRDIKENEDGTLTLLHEKADFLASCYDAIGMNFIQENVIHLNEQGEIASIDFVIPDLVEPTYTRRNTLSLEYIRGENIRFSHRQVYTNENPQLQMALSVLKDQTNFTYIKQYMNHDGTIQNTIKSYFTKEEVFFHQHDEINASALYQGGDDYDYKVILDPNTNTYTCYEYTSGTAGWKWNVCMISSTAPYILEDFSEIGPSFMDMSAAIFKKIDDTTYEIEKDMVSTIGKYFDYGMQGCQSYVFDGSTTSLTIELNDQGEIDVIKARFRFEQVETMVEFYIQDIGTTVIPTWSGSING